MVQPIDQGSILASGRALIPDYAEMALKQALMGVQQQQADTQRGQLVLEAQKAQREAQEQAEYEQATAALQENPSLDGYAALMARFPKASEALKRSWDAQDEDRKTSDFRQMAQVHDALRNNSPDLAAKVLEKRIEADKAADGTADPIDEQMLEAIRSGDPARITLARDMARRSTAIMAGPGQFASVYGVDDPKLTSVSPGEILVDQNTRAPVYQSPVPRIIPGQNGSFYTQDPIAGVPTGVAGAATGGSLREDTRPASSRPAGLWETMTGNSRSPRATPVANAAAIVQSMYPQARITDWKRNPKSALGRKNPGSWHVRSGAAVDTAPIPGTSFKEYVQSFRDKGFTIIEARDEVKNPSRHATGPHWHAVIGIPKVQSKQQYAVLPSGAQYYAPDGSLMRKK